MVSSLLFLILHIFILEKGLVIKNTGSCYLGRKQKQDN